MKIKAWPDDASVLAISDWLAQLRDDAHADDVRTEPADDDRPTRSATAAADAEPAGDGGPMPAASATWAEPAGDGGPARVPAAAAPPADSLTASVGISEPAVIGDQLRIPVAWCEMGSCISYHTDPAALGEADIRARAIAAGWRADALGRLTCPACQQTSASFWACHPVARWDRNAAITNASQMAAALRNDGGRSASRGQPCAPERADVRLRAEEPSQAQQRAAAQPRGAGLI